ncbi:MAG: AraC family transcriptional regulator ligand-binding domain-containing protein [Bdellovibrionaceae bacterium]|nr:AraC family transcriptional regulator ligand-binding domain-containing protein [Pseudobdellovibrionaceae bacterium]
MNNSVVMTVLNVMPRAIMQDLLVLGVDFSKLVAEYGLDIDSAMDPGQRIPGDLYIQLFKLAFNKTGNHFYLLDILKKTDVKGVSPFDIIIESSKNLRDVLQTLVQYKSFFNANLGFLFFDEANGGKLGLTVLNSKIPSAEVVLSEVSFFGVLSIISKVTKKSLRPTRIEFSHAPHSPIEEYEKYFDCPIKFRTNFNFIHFSEEDLQRPFALEDPLLKTLLEEKIELYLKTAGISINSSLILRVNRAIVTGIINNNLNIEKVASELVMTPRTLQRRLADSNVTFSEMVTSIKSYLACHYLRRLDLDLNRVSFLSGYSDVSSFSKSFKKSFNQTPAEYRKTII